MDAVTHPPVPVNEPVLDYAPGSPERAALTTALAAVTEPVELGAVINGTSRRPGGEPFDVVAPFDHQRVLATSANSTQADAKDAVAAAHPVEYIQLQRRRNVGLSIDPRNRRPTMTIGRKYFAQRGGYDPEMRIFGEHLVHHSEKRAGVEFGCRRYLRSWNAESFLQVLFVPHQDIDIANNAIDDF